jgi:hypothetical protein
MPRRCSTTSISTSFPRRARPSAMSIASRRPLRSVRGRQARRIALVEAGIHRERAQPLEALAEEFRSLLRAAVEDKARPRKVGCFLSGGTDSSTVVGMLGQVSGARAAGIFHRFRRRGLRRNDVRPESPPVISMPIITSTT